jgi:spermidine/putrescine transport system ATP-binding protein
MSDRICIMRDGQVVQSGSPRELYDQPANLYVADFVGKTNFIAGSVTNVNGRSVIIENEHGQTFIGSPSASAAKLSVGAAASIAIRPEMVVLGTHDANAADMNTDVALNGRIKNRIFLGEHTEYLVDAEGLGDVLVLSPKHVERAQGGFDPGDTIAIGWKNDTALVLEDS